MIGLERMTDRSRRVMQLAQKEARAFGSKTVEPEYVFAGLLIEGHGVAAHVLQYLGVCVEQLHQAIPAGDLSLIRSETDDLPCSQQTDQLILTARGEATALNHNYIGTEHLLMAVVQVAEGAVPAILAQLGQDPKTVRNEVLNILGHGSK
jgi:ATP-dependent Clp protease ATP-binding subunit ClpC